MFAIVIAVTEVWKEERGTASHPLNVIFIEMPGNSNTPIFIVKKEEKMKGDKKRREENRRGEEGSRVSTVVIESSRERSLQKGVRGDLS